MNFWREGLAIKFTDIVPPLSTIPEEMCGKTSGMDGVSCQRPKDGHGLHYWQDPDRPGSVEWVEFKVTFPVEGFGHG